MLRVCTYSKSSIHSGIDNCTQDGASINIKPNDLKEIDIKNIIISIEDMLKPFDNDEYIGLNASSFFEELNDIHSDYDLQDYIEDFEYDGEIQFIESFNNKEDDDDDYDDDEDDDEDYEDDDYSNLEDVDDLSSISYDAIDDYKVRFCKGINNDVYIEISNNVKSFTLDKKQFLSLYEG